MKALPRGKPSSWDGCWAKQIIPAWKSRPTGVMDGASVKTSNNLWLRQKTAMWRVQDEGNQKTNGRDWRNETRSRCRIRGDAYCTQRSVISHEQDVGDWSSNGYEASASCEGVCNRDQTRMWANAQRDGRPSECSWRPVFNAANFGWRPLIECRAETLPRRETRWNLLGCPNSPTDLSC